MNLKFICFVLLLLFLSGCSAGLHSIDKSNFIQEGFSNSAIVILKFSPMHLEPFSASTVNLRERGLDGKGLFQRFLLMDDSKFSRLTSDDGYFVFKSEVVSGREAKVISGLYEKNAATGEERWVTGSDCGGQMMAFQITQPGIYFLGDIKYEKMVKQSGEVVFNYTVESDFSAVTEYISRHYPAIDIKNIKLKALESYWDRSRCSAGTVYIYI